jgi:hypothetical protein
MQNQKIQNAALLTVKADGSYSYRSALKGYVSIFLIYFKSLRSRALTSDRSGPCKADALCPAVTAAVRHIAGTTGGRVDVEVRLHTSYTSGVNGDASSDLRSQLLYPCRLLE